MFVNCVVVAWNPVLEFSLVVVVLHVACCTIVLACCKVACCSL